MTLVGNSNEEKIWNYLISIIKNPYGVAGLMGNIQAESNFKPNNLENYYEQTLGMTDEEYTEAVDSGAYNNFINDCAGYGLVQWTYWSLKEKLYNFAKNRGVSIGDLQMQLDCLLSQLKDDYPYVYDELVNAKSVYDASNSVMLDFERPADQSQSAQSYRANLGVEVFNKFASFDSSEDNTGSNPDRQYSRTDAANLINSWVGLNEDDGSHKHIIDIYNSYLPHPQGYELKYTDAWCAATVSAVAIKLGYTDIIPIECSCPRMLELAKNKGIWVEDDAYIPNVGDLVLYNWDDGQDYSVTDNVGEPDHVGMVTYVNIPAGYFVVTEGNYSDSVKKRTVSINGRYIRGFICPKYTCSGTVIDNSTDIPSLSKDDETIAHEVIAGLWGNGPHRRILLETAGYDADEIQRLVNEILSKDSVDKSGTIQDQNQYVNSEVEATASAECFDDALAGVYITTADLNLRNDAGTNKRSLAIIPKGTKVDCYGYYSQFNGVTWLYIKVILDGICYIGFSCINYLKKI